MQGPGSIQPRLSGHISLDSALRGSCQVYSETTSPIIADDGNGIGQDPDLDGFPDLVTAVINGVDCSHPDRLMIVSFRNYPIDSFGIYRLTVASIEEHWIFDILYWDPLLLSRSSLASVAG